MCQHAVAKNQNYGSCFACFAGSTRKWLFQVTTCGGVFSLEIAIYYKGGSIGYRLAKHGRGGGGGGEGGRSKKLLQLFIALLLGAATC